MSAAKALVLPAHETKHLPLLVYSFRDNVVFELTQSDDGANNGTALWLGAQTDRAVFTASSIPSPTHRSRAIELGSGVGLTALALAAQGWSVIATDTPAVVHSVLRPNILRNTHNARLRGAVQVRALDWTVPPQDWCWDNTLNITGSPIETDSDKDSREEELQGPPFDLIITSDTIYSPELVAPLLRTLKHLILISSPSYSPFISESVSNSTSNSKSKKHHPPVYLALEVRDPAQIASFFGQARDIWGLIAQKVPTPRVRRAMSHSGLRDWKGEDWKGVEVWRMYSTDFNSNGCSNNISS